MYYHCFVTHVIDSIKMNNFMKFSNPAKNVTESMQPLDLAKNHEISWKCWVSWFRVPESLKKNYVLKVSCNLAAGDRNPVKMENENMETAKHHEFHHEFHHGVHHDFENHLDSTKIIMHFIMVLKNHHGFSAIIIISPVFTFTL